MVVAAAKRLRLSADPRRMRQGAGTRLGAGPGASLEFHDHRDYVAGDDTRQLDWGVLARSDQLVIRRHRQEAAPRAEVLFDTSASMAHAPTKQALAAQLAALLLHLAAGDGGRARLWLVGGVPAPITAGWQIRLKAVACSSTADPAAGPALALAAGSDRWLVSDGLSPGGGAAVVRRLGAAAGRIALIQVLTRDEIEPPELGPARLVDHEGGAADMLVDAQAVAGYRARLARHQSGWQAALAGRGLGLITCAAEDGFAGAVRRLLAAGVVAPRSGA